MDPESTPLETCHNHGCQLYLMQSFASILFIQRTFPLIAPRKFGKTVSRKCPSGIMSRILTMQEKHPELFMTSNEDPRKRKRVVPMQVLSLGMPRTGTACMIIHCI